jgi:putative hydrolase of the HAD superfamily
MTAPAVDWQRVRAVVFDVDGTLYDQHGMRLRMARELALRCLARPATLRDARILTTFRRLREELAEGEATGIGRLQYDRTAERLGLPVDRIEAVVEEWILRRPLRHAAACRRAGVRRLFAELRGGGHGIGVWSDYPAAGKLAAMGLTADAVVCATDPEVDRLKPRPEGLTRLLGILGVGPAEALVIGDRDERDGEAARRAGCPYLLIVRRPGAPHEIAGFPPLLDAAKIGRDPSLLGRR